MRTLFDTLHAYRRWFALEFGSARGSRMHGSASHLALFAWSLPPSTWAGVYRPLSFLEYAPRVGWRVTAFGGETTERDRVGGDELLARIPGTCTVHTLARTQRVPSWSFFPRTNGGFLDALEFARSAIRRLQADPPSAVLASGPTFEMFITAMFVARRFRVPLILDYRDEWTECPFAFVRLGNADRRWERRCLASADKVLFTTESQLRHHLAVFAELTQDKGHVLPNGWEPAEFTAAGGEADRPRVQEGRLTIALVGNLADHAPPDGFLATFGRLLAAHPEWQERVVIEFIGRKSPEAITRIRTFPFAANVRCIDHLSKTQAVHAMRRADALLLIALPDLRRYLPGKLFDYLAAERPVVVFGARGEASELIGTLEVGFHCGDGDDVRLLDILLKLRKGEDLTRSPRVTRWLEAHRRDVLAGRFYALLDELQRSRKGTTHWEATSSRPA